MRQHEDCTDVKIGPRGRWFVSRSTQVDVTVSRVTRSLSQGSCCFQCIHWALCMYILLLSVCFIWFGRYLFGLMVNVQKIVGCTVLNESLLSGESALFRFLHVRSSPSAERAEGLACWYRAVTSPITLFSSSFSPAGSCCLGLKLCLAPKVSHSLATLLFLLSGSQREVSGHYVSKKLSLHREFRCRIQDVSVKPASDFCWSHCIIGARPPV